MTELYIHLEKGKVYTSWLTIRDMWPHKRKQGLHKGMVYNHYEIIDARCMSEYLQFSTVYLN